jgi:NADP-dependent 3-hydroxy acid dehydrogenase YdfG
MKAKNKVIVVTGAGNGIGRAVTLDLISKGAKVFGVDLSEERLQETASLTNPGSFKYASINVADRSRVETLPEQVLNAFGQVDGIFNVAGIIHPFTKVSELDYDTIDRVFQVNFNGTLYMVKTFLPHLLKRPEAHILNVSSMGGFIPVPGQTLYGASKAAVKLLSEGLHSELSDTRVGVTVVFPGGVSTNITGNSGVDTTKMMEKVSQSSSKVKTLTPAQAAELIVNGMETNQYHVYAGSDSKMLNMFTRISPRRAAKIIAEQLKSLLG